MAAPGWSWPGTWLERAALGGGAGLGPLRAVPPLQAQAGCDYTSLRCLLIEKSWS